MKDFLENYHSLYAGLKKLEGTPPFSYGNQNIISITRHYMAVIYMFGILEYMIRVLFPVFLIPLILGLTYRWEKQHWFVMVVVFFYLFIFYYALIKRDFIEIRFVFMPVFLLYSWVGYGLDRIWTKVRNSSYSKFWVFLFLVSFIFLPVYKTGNSIFSQDSVLRQAGQWLAENPDFAKARLATTDSRISFYAENMDNSLYISNKEIKNKYPLIEKMALQDKSLLIAEKVRKGSEPFKGFKHYRIAKSFHGKINTVHFYRLVTD